MLPTRVGPVTVKIRPIDREQNRVNRGEPLAERHDPFDTGSAPVEQKPAPPGRRRVGRARVSGDLIRAVRRSLGLSQGELREPLRVGHASLARYEQGDAPAWMQYALIGVGVLERGVPVDEMVRRVAASEAEGTKQNPRDSTLLEARLGP